MSKSYQEQIMESLRDDCATNVGQSMTLRQFDAISDCWTITRLENEIMVLSCETEPSSFDQSHAIGQLEAEIAAILNKYGIKP